MAEPPPSVLFELLSAGQLANELLARELEPRRLKVGAHALLLLLERSGRLTPTELEARTGLRSSTLRERMQPLLDGEQVVRRPSAVDRRSHSFEVTARGRELIRDAHPLVEAAELALAAHLAEPLVDSRRALETLARAARDTLAAERKSGNRDLT